MLCAPVGRGEACLLESMPIPSVHELRTGLSLHESEGEPGWGRSVGLAGDRLERSLPPLVAWSGRPPPASIPDPAAIGELTSSITFLSLP